ncbi:hypothetical protein GCK32_020783 [Trichostrongylus colubriformis]|uniref:Uncharacterized protein n=1 Tax=Trichostrongylus colubriformis TaxID=6319 RepID=A0AAN8IRP2_TRICO
MGIIQELVCNSQGTVREAVVRLPSRRRIRRPVNLLIPLEIEEDDGTILNNSSDDHRDAEASVPAHSPNIHDGPTEKEPRYHLRNRRPINYNEDLYDRRAPARVNTFSATPYELCADHYCVEFGNPSNQETVIFPPQVRRILNN